MRQGTKTRSGRLSLQRRVLSRVPDSWLHPLLTGPDAVVGKPPFTCQDVERLLLKIRKSIKRAFAEEGR